MSSQSNYYDKSATALESMITSLQQSLGYSASHPDRIIHRKPLRLSLPAAVPLVSAINCKLPTEIAERILFYCRDSKSLLKWRLVDRRFCCLASRLLLHRPLINSIQAMQRLLRLINNTAAPNGPLLLIANIKQLDFSALPTRSVVMTDEGILKSLIKCDPVCLSLRHLDLSNCTRITDDCMANFLEKCENLQWLRLDGCDQLTDRCFIGRQWHRLLHISLRGCRQLTNQTLLALSRTENGQPGCLRSFSITFARQINGEGLIELCKIHGECLRLLEVCGSGKLTNCHLECISRYATGIQDLCLRFNYGRLSADGVCTALEKWSQLRRMQITLPLVSTTEHGWVRMRIFNNDQLSELRAQYPKVTFVDDSD